MAKIDEKYIFNYSNDDLHVVRLILLAASMLLDLITIVGIVTCFTAKRYIDLVLYFILILISITIKTVSGFITYQISFIYDSGNLKIIKKYPIKAKVLYDGAASALKIKRHDISIEYDMRLDEKRHKSESKECDRDVYNEKYQRLCSKTCADSLYMIELNGKKYLTKIDDYMYSLIEVNCDLS
ncbi:MAG: hypothetical protein HFE33_00385 [Clostridia bacterium]|nr:hypothetical protein [Clostridia bacterium]